MTRMKIETSDVNFFEELRKISESDDPISLLGREWLFDSYEYGHTFGIFDGWFLLRQIRLLHSALECG